MYVVWSGMVVPCAVVSLGRVVTKVLLSRLMYELEEILRGLI